VVLGAFMASWRCSLRWPVIPAPTSPRSSPRPSPTLNQTCHYGSEGRFAWISAGRPRPPVTARAGGAGRAAAAATRR
jgi:hypothetical protein